MEQLNFADVGPVEKASGRKFKPSDPIPESAEVATIQKGELLGEFGQLELPNPSEILRNRADGRGVRLYDRMLLTDGDINSFLRDLTDDVLRMPLYVRAASPAPIHQEHKRLAQFQITRMRARWQNAHRHVLKSYWYGYSVLEKMYEVVDRGEWAGAVVFRELIDKPARWFTFDPEKRLRFRTIENQIPGELVDQNKFKVVSWGTNNTPWGDPIADPCYWPYFLRHIGFRNQATFFDKWATPTGLITYESGSTEQTNKTNRLKALTVMQAIQNDQSIAVPKGILIELLESKRNGSISFEQYLDQLRNILSRILTGQILLGTGEKGGSYAMAKVHQEQEGNRVETLADFSSGELTGTIQEVIDRNYGSQDAYPTVEIFSTTLAEQQAWLEVESLKQSTGHKVSVSWSDRQLQNVSPEDEADVLVKPPDVQPAQPLPVPAAFAGTAWAARSERIRKHLADYAAAKEAARNTASLAALRGHRELHAHAVTKAAKMRAHLDGVAAEATRKARPALKRVLTSIGSKIRKKSKARDVTKSFLLKSVQGYDGSGLGAVFDGMIRHSPRLALGAYALNLAAPSDLEASDAAKIALALAILSLLDSIAREAADTPGDMSAKDFADSLLDENAASGSLLDTQARIFENTHPTNIASIATGYLRARLADPAFRKRFPYVMIVSQADARLDHRMMDGYILSAEEARYSDLLPPYGFGCRCVPVPISAETAVSMGLTGASPVGTLEEFMRAQGATTTGGYRGFTTAAGTPFTAGPASGFDSPFTTTDMFSQLAALRQKSEELRAEDPEAWAALHRWLLVLFGFDILKKDPKPEPPPDTTGEEDSNVPN